MEDCRDFVLRCIREALAVFGMADAGLAEEICDRWSEPHRYYHTLEHLSEVIRRLVLMTDPGDDLAALVLAAGGHDIVEEPGAADNVERSRLLIVDRLHRRGASDGLLEVVGALVDVTGAHRPETALQRKIVDADLGILAEEPARYWRYVGDVRREYPHVSDADWKVGRAGVLRHLVRPGEPVFHTSLMRDREWLARANVAAELAWLAAA